jgi:iron-only hydrogenase group A
MAIIIEINGIEYNFDKAVTILDAAKKIGLKIPSLCHHPDITNDGKCRICSVEIEGNDNLVTSCNTLIAKGMKIKTHSNKVIESRKMILELLLSNHYTDCISCAKTNSCELKEYAQEYNINENKYGNKVSREYEVEQSYSIQKDNDKCILCGRCTSVCEQLQSVNAICETQRGEKTYISTGLDIPLKDSICINCGQCILRCPTGALSEKNDTQYVWDAINDPKKHVVIQTAPAPRAAIGEEFGTKPGKAMTKELTTALKIIGFDKVFDTDFAADLTIMEEGFELLKRLEEQKNLPLITSCSPGWIKFAEHFYSDHLDLLSTCKSPQQMYGAVIKTYYAKKMKINAKDIVSVSLMPCTAKKFECNRPEMNASNHQDVDYVITTRECADMIKQKGLHLPSLPKSEFDDPIGFGSGAGVIFGSTGGVMEAALRTAYEVITGREVPFKNLEITPVRGMKGIKETSITITDTVEKYKALEGATLNIAIAHGTANAKIIMERIKEGTAPWHFIEIMACPGGCLSGGGQPIPTNLDIRKKRAKAIYDEDNNTSIRKSHLNPQIKMIYEEFLKEPLGSKSHKLLHTKYTKRCQL